MHAYASRLRDGKRHGLESSVIRELDDNKLTDKPVDFNIEFGVYTRGCFCAKRLRAIAAKSRLSMDYVGHNKTSAVV